MIMTEMSKEDKLIELKEMVIGWKISKKINDGDWNKYKKMYDREWIEEEGLKILLSNEVMEMIKDQREQKVRDIFDLWNFSFVTQSSVSSSSVQHILFEMSTSLSDRVESGSNQWNIHRVMCLVVGRMMKKCENCLSEETCVRLVNYMVKLIEISSDMETVKCAILAVERCWLRIAPSGEIKQQLVVALQGHTSYLSQVSITSDFKHLDSIRYQVSWCAQWCIEHLLGEVSIRRIPLVKFSRDRCEVRNDTDEDVPARSQFFVTSGVYYYEVIPVTYGEMRFGWSTREAQLSKWIKIGDDKHSIGLEVKMPKCYVYHNKQQISDTIICHPFSVIGCLIDFENQQFKFYINGEEIELTEGVHFSTKNYYTTSNLSPRQQCLFNFGQTPFKKPLENIKFDAFHDNAHIDKYLFTETIEFKNKNYCYFWFVHGPTNGNHVDLFYCDPKQDESDELVRQLEYIEHNQTTQLDHSVECGRLVQSVIEVLDRKLNSDHTDLITRWIKEETKKINDFEKAKLLELICSYFQLPVTPSNSTKCQNISLISVMLYFNNFFFKCHLIESFDILFSQTLKTINFGTFLIDPWTVIYVLNCLESLYLPLATQALLKDSTAVLTLSCCSELFSHVSSVSRLYEPSCDFVILQAGVCVRWFRNRVMGHVEQHFSSPSTLNPDDKTEYLKLSSDCLSARNDSKDWQSVRSASSASGDIFYYEAILLTDGKMRIGWTTKQTELNRSVIGLDECSIGFDGSDGYEIVHQRENFSNSRFPKQSKHHWSAGDVVGCLIDLQKKQFQFFLNDQQVEISKKYVWNLDKYIDFHKGKNYFLHVCADPYYAAVSLHEHQQCYLNLGQSPFRHPPSVPFSTFHPVSPNTPPTPLYSPRMSECYSLVQVLVKERVELVFDDEKQKEIDETTGKLEESENALISLKNEVNRLRIIQSVIEVSGTKLVSCLDVHANWVARLITLFTSDNATFPDQVSQLLYPYFTLHLTEKTTIKHRNVCIILFSIITKMKNLKQTNLHQQILMYLTEIVSSCNFVDEFLLLVALIALGKMNIDETDRKQLQSHVKFCKMIESKRSLDLNDKTFFPLNLNLYLIRQTVFLSQWIFYHFLQSKQETQYQVYSREILDSSNCSAHIKLSPDRLSARSDRNWQSVRSITSLSSKKYFFEVTIATSGPMRLGWAAENVDLKERILGNDKYSIGYDGHNRCIWHGGKQIPIANVSQWSVRDVVGCMVLINEKRFKFYLNNQSIKLPLFTLRPHFSSVKSYYAAASLFTFQQCQFNFSAKTKIEPRRASFRVMDAARNSILYKGCVQLVNQSLHAVNSVIAYNGNLNAGNLALSLTYPNHNQNNRLNSLTNSVEDILDINKSQFFSKTNNPQKLEDNFDENGEDEELTK